MTRESRGPLQSVRLMAERTPSYRNRHVDLVRAVAICAVVLGHWLVAIVLGHHLAAVFDEGPAGIQGITTLAEMDWVHPVTWLFQVMPVVFFVGGYANAASLSTHLERGGDSAGWLMGRAPRFLAPTTVLLAVIVGCATAASFLGTDPELVSMASWAATMPLWFLAAYLGMVLLAPLTFRLHRRFGLAVVLVLVALVAGLDMVQFPQVVEVPEAVEHVVKHLFAWLAVHQAGYCWHDGQLPTRAWANALLAGSGLALAALFVALGPYPVSMVTVPGLEDSNFAPPTAPMLALSAAQIGLIMLLSGPSNRLLQRTRPWSTVVAINAVVFSLFLWHMSVVVVGAGLLYVVGIMPQSPADFGQWLVRMSWLLAFVAILLVLVAAVGWVEARSGRAAIGGRLPTVSRWLVPAGMATCIAALIFIGFSGPEPTTVMGLPLEFYVLYFLGAAIVRWAPSTSR